MSTIAAEKYSARQTPAHFTPLLLPSRKGSGGRAGSVSLPLPEIKGLSGVSGAPQPAVF
jgi:hypothetical protein